MRSLKTDRVFAQACLCCASCAKLRCSVSLLRPKLLQRFAAMALSTAGGTLIAVVTWEGRRRKHNKRHDMSWLCHAGRMRERTTEDYWGLLRTNEDYCLRLDWDWNVPVHIRAQLTTNEIQPFYLISAFPENSEPFGIAVAGRTLAVWSWVPGFVWKLLEPTRYIIMDIGGCKRLCYVVLGNRDLTWLVWAAKLVIECHRLILSLHEAERGWE
jgi:hypothetical protein